MKANGYPFVAILWQRDVRSIDFAVTDLAVIGFPGGQITLLETAPVSVAEVIAAREADLFIPNDVREIKL